MSCVPSPNVTRKPRSKCVHNVEVMVSYVAGHLKNTIDPCHAELFYDLYSSPNVILLNCSFSVRMYFISDSEWKTVWILIRWLHQKPADLDLQCFQKRINHGSAGQSVKVL